MRAWAVKVEGSL